LKKIKSNFQRCNFIKNKGKCVKNLNISVCEVYAWCPLEEDRL
jgi:hypothetical protein